jgi:NarL family two-component system response regulator LiaR
VNVLLIDDHPLLSAGLVSVLEGTNLFRVSGQAKSLAEAMKMISESPSLPALIILDVILGEENGLDFLPMLEKYCREEKLTKPPVLVCSAITDSFRIQTALKLGAAGYLSKSGGSAELLQAIDAILCGKVYLSSELNIELDKTFDMYAKFTKRETQIINLIQQNKTNQQIAQNLGISLRTVENHISKIYFKTGFSSRKNRFFQP